MLKAFNAVLQRRPLATQMLFAGSVSAGGDVLAQALIEEKYDPIRSFRFAALAGLFIAPSLHHWFHVLDRIKGGPMKLLPLKRLAIDQVFFSPVFNASILFNLRVLEGFSPAESFEKMKNDWWPIWSTSIRIWPAVQLINLYFVPIHYRVILIQTVAFFWNSFLSFKTQSAHLEKHIQ